MTNSLSDLDITVTTPPRNRSVGIVPGLLTRRNCTEQGSGIKDAKSARFGTRFNPAVLLLGLVTVWLDTGNLFAQQSPSHYLRAPDVIPRTLPEMRAAAFWIERMENPGEVVMTANRIKAMNGEYDQRMRRIAGQDDDAGRRVRQQLGASPGLFAYGPDPDSLEPDKLSGAVREVLESQIQYMRRRPFGNILGIEYAFHELAALEEEMFVDGVRGRIEPQPGITVSDSRLRIIPALRPEYVGLTQAGKTRWDVWNLDVLPVASPVEILHVSASGGHLFVLSEYGYGWVKSERIAMASREVIDGFIHDGDFIVFTGDRVPFYSDPEVRYVSGWARMGARLPLANPGNYRVVQVPVRQMNGEFAVQQAWLAPNAEVHTGFLPFTRENVVVQGFKMLDNIYDWTGAWYGRNDGTVLRDIFRTFGFEIPANGVLLSMFVDQTSEISSDLSRPEKYSAIASAEPFLTFMTSRSGHSLLYMGDYEGEPIVFDTNGYGYENAEGREIEVRRWGIATLSLPDYFLNQDITVTPVWKAADTSSNSAYER